MIGVGVYKYFPKSIPAKISESCTKCNVILIDIDLLRSDALPCYGYFRNTAPNICDFSLQSVKFTQNYSQSNWTLPGSFSTITSLLPTFHKIRTVLIDKLNPEIPTLAETLQKAGYRTILVNNWPTNPGFLTDQNGGTRGYDLITSQPIEELMAELKKTDQPWFVHYYLNSLHLPYLISETEVPLEDLPKPAGFPANYFEYDLLLNKYLRQNYLEVFKKNTIKKYSSIILAPEKPNDLSLLRLFRDLYFDKLDPGEFLLDFNKPEFMTYLNSFDHTDPASLAYLRMMYDTKISQLDLELKPLLNRLTTSEYNKNTVTVISSAHGENFGEYGAFNHFPDKHSFLFSTPLIIRAPQLKPAIINQTSSNMDIFPTLLDLVNLKQVPALQGYSLVPFLLNNAQIAREYILTEDSLGTNIQNRTWYYYLPNNTHDVNESILYNKILDPEEKNNIAASNVELVTFLFKQVELLRSYDTYNSLKMKPENKGVEYSYSQEKIKRMKIEGYF